MKQTERCDGNLLDKEHLPIFDRFKPYPTLFDNDDYVRLSIFHRN